MNLIIAEKPELGRDIARALIGNDYKEKESVIQNDEWTIVWAYGHILELVEPSELDENITSGRWKIYQFILIIGKKDHPQKNIRKKDVNT